MKKIAFLLLIMITIGWQTKAIKLDDVRSNYAKAVNDKSICENMIEVLKNEKSNAIFIAYLGAFQAVMANHYSNPINKLKTFNKGKSNIEKAVKMNAQNVEIRFIRLSIQKNAPTILGYSGNIKSDKNYILKNLATVQSASLKKNILQIINQ